MAEGAPQVPMAPVPVLDLSALDGAVAARAALARKVDETCRDSGFLVFTGHGVDPALISEFDRVATAFFDGPAALKASCCSLLVGNARGYSAVGARALGRTLGDANAAEDLRETFTMGPPRIDPDDPYYSHPVARQLCQPNLFPPDMPALSDVMHRYYAAMEGLADRVMRVFALALGLEEHWFETYTRRHISNLAVTNYPELVDPPLPGQLRAGAHTDYGDLTILRAEERPGGLEIARETVGGRREWFTAPVAPDSYIVNIGDMMARWTNDRWRSTLHRVAAPPLDSTGPTRRLSLIFFHQPDHDAAIVPLPGTGEAKYPPTTSGEHMLEKIALSRAARGAAPA
jgi:isopenicillin N synthase-like dioxygenase